MSPAEEKTLAVFAPAKINLYLHVTGQRPNGYHTLDSLISFADIGDEVVIEPSEAFELSFAGPFAGAFKGKDVSAAPDSSNLVARAVWALSRLTGKAPSIKITLVKNLPLGAGIGGGSADAAATLWGLLEFWSLPKTLQGLEALMLSLGADVPACFACVPQRILGIGEILQTAPDLPELPIVLAYPGKPCHTAKIFAQRGGAFSEPLEMPAQLHSLNDTVAFLNTTHNALSTAAQASVPEIRNVLETLTAQSGCALARMSGSGSCCFGIFEHEQHAETAAMIMTEENPDWWVRCSWLGRTGRY